MSTIESFVFFDIETTGLPWQEKNQTKIIEFSFVAASRKDLEITPFESNPAVSKLTFVLNPQRQIHPVVTQMTGLTNDALRHAPLFAQKVKSVIAFLEDLPKPVCLVAHNGNCFDFKILLAECQDADVSLPEDLLCVDSLVGFRNLLKVSNITYKDLKDEIQAPSSSTDELLTDDEEDEWPHLDVSTEEWNEIDEICVSLSDVSCEDLEEQAVTEVKKQRSNAIRDVFIKKSNEVTKTHSNSKNKNASKRRSQSQAVDNSDFKLTTLYKRLLNKEEADAHRAEVDCIMLAQCVVALKNHFLTWSDKNCKLLTEIKPLVRYY